MHIFDTIFFLGLAVVIVCVKLSNPHEVYMVARGRNLKIKQSWICFIIPVLNEYKLIDMRKPFEEQLTSLLPDELRRNQAVAMLERVKNDKPL